MKILKVKGKDAADFLHRVTAGTVKGVRKGQGAPGLLLNGQSRMIAQFDLLRTAEDEFLLVAPEPCFAALVAELERLHFAEDLSQEALGFYGVVTQIGPAEKRVPVFSFTGTAGDLRWPAPVPGYEISLSDMPSPLPSTWEFDRIGAAVPWPPLDWDAHTPALEAATLPWIDRDKGCYPGQEVVERSLNVGHPARLLLPMEGESPLVPATKVPLAAGGEGMVASVAVQGQKVRAFVRVPWAKREDSIAGFRLLCSPS